MRCRPLFDRDGDGREQALVGDGVGIKSRLIISPVADRASLQRMGVEAETSVNVSEFSNGQRAYLDFCRSNVLQEATR